MEKKNYIKMSFPNCGLDYDYTICEFWEINDHLTLVESILADDNPKDHEDYGKPQVIIESIELTDKEYEDFISKLEEEA